MGKPNRCSLSGCHVNFNCGCQHVSLFRDPNFKSKDEDDDDGFMIDYDNLNFYEMEMYPSPMYDPDKGPGERCVLT